MMLTRHQPLTYQPSKYDRGRVVNDDVADAPSSIVEASVIVESEPVIVDAPVPVEESKIMSIVSEIEQFSGRQVIDDDPRTHDDLRKATLDVIKKLDEFGFTENEKKALRMRVLFGNNNAHVEMTGHTMAAIRKIQNHMVELGDTTPVPSELTERTLKYFVLGGQNNLDAIYAKLRRSFSEIEFEPRDVERWLGLGLEALYTAR